MDTINDSITSKANKTDLVGLVNESDIEGLASKEFVLNEIDKVEIPNNTASSGKKYSTVVIGLSTMGYTADDVDFLCTGTNDDVVINQAIKSMVKGGELKILEGEYNITNELIIENEGITISGRNAKLLCSVAEDIENIISIKADYTVIDSIRFIGNDAMSQVAIIASKHDGEIVDGTITEILSNCKIIDCYFENFGIAIGIMGNINFIVKENHIVDCEYGILSIYNDNTKVSNNYINNCVVGIYIDYDSVNTVINNKVYNAEMIGISLYSIRYSNIAENVVMRDDGYPSGDSAVNSIAIDGQSVLNRISNNLIPAKDVYNPNEGDWNVVENNVTFSDVF